MIGIANITMIWRRPLKNSSNDLNWSGLQSCVAELQLPEEELLERKFGRTPVVGVPPNSTV
jgi:hypothetical protein